MTESIATYTLYPIQSASAIDPGNPDAIPITIRGSISAEGIDRNTLPNVDELLGLIEGPEWQQRAACRDSKVNFFSKSEGVIEEAQAICAACEVRAECEAYTVRHNDQFGVWAGRVREPQHLALKDRIIQAVTDEPFRYTRTELSKRGLGRAERIRRMVLDMAAAGDLAAMRKERPLKASRLMPCGSHMTVTVYGPPEAA